MFGRFELPRYYTADLSTPIVLEGLGGGPGGGEGGSLRDILTIA